MAETYSFGYWVLRRRKALDWTRAELADRVGCAPVTIKKIERDERRPSRQIANLLADALAVPDEEREAFVQAARGEGPVDRLRMDPHPPRPLSASLHNLPPQTTPFIGRQAELDEITSLLAGPDCRLVTLVGPGGAGKSRLSLRVAEAQLGLHRHGVYLVPLAGIASSQLLPSAIAAAINVELLGKSDPGRQLLNVLQNKQMLLLLDNFEHLLPGTGLLEDLLHEAPGVTLLVTSRAPLKLHAEWVFPLTGLPFPDTASEDDFEHSPAVDLFLRSSHRLRVNFTLLEIDKPPLVRICQLVDGLPLAIELAASWTHLLSGHEIAREIERGINILATSARDVPARHRSMRAVFDHSWKLLLEEERIILRQLSVFRGSFTRQAAEQVAGASLDLLSALVDKSLLRLLPRSGNTQRYDLHELVRQYSHERLEEAQEADQAYDRHLDYYLQLAETAEPNLLGPDSLTWLDRLARDHDNLRAAFSWATNSAPAYHGEEAQRFVRALMWFWAVRGPLNEGLRWAERALSLESDHAPSRAGAVWVAGYFSHFIGDHSTAHQMLEQGVAMCRQLGPSGARELAWALNFLGMEESYTDLAAAQAWLEESLALWQELHDPCGIAPALLNLGYNAWEQGDYDNARRLFEKGLEAARASGDPSWLILANNCLGELAADRGDDIRARSLYGEALQICQELRSNWWAAESLALLARLEASQEDAARSERAARLWGASETLYKNSGSDPRQLNYNSTKPHLTTVRRRLGDDAFTAAWTQGQSMSFNQALSFALEGNDVADL
jgi:predicted ATPase/transcriptional regulator with XRE-family HTH domain